VKKILLTLISAVLLIVGLTACTSNSKANVASQNLSTAADNFEIQRHIVFFNGITDKYLLEITGLCSLGNNDPTKRLSVTCKVGPNKYVKHFLGLSDNVSYFVEQIKSADVSVDHYRVIFRPQTLIPDIQIGG
jgi:ABC-type Fe3+-hydroxamate transport system substrate-binding protein